MAARPAPIKLSSPATREFWELEILFEDDHLLAIQKPSRLLTSPDRYDPERPNLMRLLHDGIRKGAPWARERALTYLANVHRLDFETSGVLLLAKTRPALVDLASQFGSEKPAKSYLALVSGNPPNDTFSVDLKLAPDLRNPGRMMWSRHGKKSLTHFEVLERFGGTTALRARPVTGRTHQIRVHLKSAGLPIHGDAVYGGKPLFLSRLKPAYRLKADQEERPLTPGLALHAQSLTITHPVTRLPISIECEPPRDLRVALKYLRRYATPSGPG